MKIKFISLLFVLIIIICACNNGCIKTHLSNDEREWFSVYEKGDKIIFKSNLGNFDTLVITSVTNDFTNLDCNRMGVGKFQQEFINVRFQPKSWDTMIQYNGGEIAIYKNDPDQYVYPSFKIFGLEYDDVVQKHNFISEKIKLTSNNKSYSVYSFKEEINATNYGKYLTSYYWNMDDGLIRYVLKKGEIFDFVKKIKLPK